MVITSALPRLLTATAAPAMTWLPQCHSTPLSSTTTEVTARAHIARARLGLVLSWCSRGVPGYPLDVCKVATIGRYLLFERERAQWHDPVLGRGLGLTPERPALCLRGCPRRPTVALGRVSDPRGWIGVREPWGRLRYAGARGTIREKRYNTVRPRPPGCSCRAPHSEV